VQFWLFATPVIYSRPPENASFWIRALVAGNPLSGLIGSFRAALFNDPIPWSMLGFAMVAAIVLFVSGALYFRRVEDTFADLV
jgi:lipopolysaccharide transport system permease protein